MDAIGAVAHHAPVGDGAERGGERPPRAARAGAAHWAGLVLAVATAGVVSPRVVAASESTIAHPLATSPRLIGDLGGRRSRLERLGVTLRLFYDQFLSGKASGGGRNPDSVFGSSGSYDFFTQVDLEALTGWPGADVLLHVKGQYDRNLNAAVGALGDPIDDADFDAPIYVDELWIQQAALDDRVRLRVGFAEQQTVFDRNAFANSEDRQFLNASLDNNGLVPLPNGLAVSLIAVPARWIELAIGIADADNRPRQAGFDTFGDGFDSLTGYFEAALASPWAGRGLAGRYRLGVFLDGRARPGFADRRVTRGHAGAYLSFDQVVLRHGAGRRAHLGLFARAGWADPDVNRVEWLWSVGLESAGAIPGRSRDVLGFGVYQTIASSSYRSFVDPRFDRETGIELYYAAQALGWLVVTPDLQYIVDPGATGAAGDAFVASLRVRVTF